MVENIGSHLMVAHLVFPTGRIATGPAVQLVWPTGSAAGVVCAPTTAAFVVHNVARDCRIAQPLASPLTA